MKNFLRRKAPVLAFVVAAFAILQAQVRQSDGAIHMGSKNTPVRLEGNVDISSTDGGLTISNGTLTVTSGTNTFAAVKTTLLDAGSGIINGNLVISGTATEAVTKTAVLDAGVAWFNGEVGIVSPSTTVTTCTLNAASPSVCTATVRAGSKCTCSNVGASAAIAAAGCAVGLSGTTLTVTSANAANNVVNIHCF